MPWSHRQLALFTRNLAAWRTEHTSDRQVGGVPAREGFDLLDGLPPAAAPTREAYPAATAELEKTPPAPPRTACSGQDPSAETVEAER